MAGVSAVQDFAFEAFLEAAIADSPPDLKAALKGGLMNRYNNPHLADLELCLGRGVPLAKARQLLFYPTEDDMRLYPQLLAMPPAAQPQPQPQPGGQGQGDAAPPAAPQLRVQICALTSLYLVHSKRWDRVQPFIEAGGLRALVPCLVHPNAYLASQALSCLLHITDEDAVFPWHDPPQAPGGRGPRAGPYAAAWRGMYELSSTAFLPTLLSHYRHPPLFPGAPDMALRLFAFYVSWMRRHFTKDSRLSLSQGLLDLLQRWAGDAGATPEERELAKQLHEDFSRFPPAAAPAPAPGAGAAGAQGPLSLGGLDGEEGGEDGWDLRVAAERTVVNGGPTGDEAEALKEQGNEAYRRGNHTVAVERYSAALDVLVPLERLPSEGPRRAAYHTNRAAAYMARAEAGILREGDYDTCGHLEGVDHGSEGAVARHYEAAVLDCDMALALLGAGGGADLPGGGQGQGDVSMAVAKACRRKARALLRLGRREEVGEAARAGLAAAGACEDGGLRDELQELLREAEGVGGAAGGGGGGAGNGAGAQEQGGLGDGAAACGEKSGAGRLAGWGTMD